MKTENQWRKILIQNCTQNNVICRDSGHDSFFSLCKDVENHLCNLVSPFMPKWQIVAPTLVGFWDQQGLRRQSSSISSCAPSSLLHIHQCETATSGTLMTSTYTLSTLLELGNLLEISPVLLIGNQWFGLVATFQDMPSTCGLLTWIGCQQYLALQLGTITLRILVSSATRRTKTETIFSSAAGLVSVFGKWSFEGLAINPSYSTLGHRL